MHSAGMLRLASFPHTPCLCLAARHRAPDGCNPCVQYVRQPKHLSPPAPQLT